MMYIYRKLSCKLDAAEFELFDDIGDLLKTMDVPMTCSFSMSNDQEGWFFKQKHFISFHKVSKFS